MKSFNKIKLYILTLTLSIFLIPCIALANANNVSSSHPILYEIYDESGVLVETGILPSSEKESSSRQSYGSFTLANGQIMYLKNPATGKPFNVLANTKMQLRFALNRTANMRVTFWDQRYNTSVGSPWEGLTGGLSISRTTPSNREAYVQVEIQNFSSDPVTVLWATLEF